ncbi:hypothetical protein [Haladaptatus litoreus]|uniref:hypothetical protein n=1 Tax=Haladaptatus litoreus TaxID=553468 RepID=UPI0009706EC7|nr:hypothetical protein [Haladaptatus litoreus]
MKQQPHCLLAVAPLASEISAKSRSPHASPTDSLVSLGHPSHAFARLLGGKLLEVLQARAMSLDYPAERMRQRVRTSGTRRLRRLAGERRSRERRTK